MFNSNARCSLVKEFPTALKNIKTTLEPVTIFYDNTVALVVVKDPKYYGKTKHTKKRYHYIRDVIIENDVVLKYISTSNMVADPLNKPIVRDVFVKHVRSLSLCRM